jgi:hypothetical protein
MVPLLDNCLKKNEIMSQESIVIKWDGSAESAKWNVELYQKEQLMLSSADSAFPFNTGDFGPLEEDALISAVKSSFPSVPINIVF